LAFQDSSFGPSSFVCSRRLMFRLPRKNRSYGPDCGVWRSVCGGTRKLLKSHIETCEFWLVEDTCRGPF